MFIPKRCSIIQPRLRLVEPHLSSIGDASRVNHLANIREVLNL